MKNISPSPKAIRSLILNQAFKAKVGHIGSALSIADLIYVLLFEVIKSKSWDDPDRDRFILSKGHAALALYAGLHLKGWLSGEALQGYCADGSMLGDHPEHHVQGVEFSTGSLGHGLSIAAGATLAAQLQKSNRSTYVILSDAECNEGSTWEAVMFAGHHKLKNLTAIIDLNGQQAFGYTKDVLNLEPLAEKWKAFGWETLEVDGHETAKLKEALLKPRAGAPRVILAKTVCGKGVSYMQNKIKWHYWPMSDEEFKTALHDSEALP